jgi:hypothetical protein
MEDTKRTFPSLAPPLETGKNSAGFFFFHSWSSDSVTVWCTLRADKVPLLMPVENQRRVICGVVKQID